MGEPPRNKSDQMVPGPFQRLMLITRAPGGRQVQGVTEEATEQAVLQHGIFCSSFTSSSNALICRLAVVKKTSS